MQGLIEGFIKKYWLQPFSILFVLILEIASICIFIPEEKDADILRFKIICVVYIIILIIYIVFVILHNKLPRAKDDEIAVLFIINTESEKQYDETKRKIGKNFNAIINWESKVPFKVIYIQYHRVKKICLSSKEVMKKLLRKTNCTLLINIEIDSDDKDNEENYLMKIDTAIVHNKYPDDIYEKFLEDFNAVTGYVGKIHYSKNRKIQVLQVKSIQMAFACKYIIGITLMLSLKFKEAEAIFNELLEMVKNTNNQVSIYLKKAIPTYCSDIELFLATQNARKYMETGDIIFVDEMHIHLDKSNKYVQDTYGYFLIMAMYYFFKGRFIKDAKICLNKCKELSPNDSWKYSDAFLCAYTNKSASTVLRKYKQALKVDIKILDIIMFVEKALEMEPDKSMLKFALGLLYYHVGNTQSMTSCFDDFLSDTNISKLDKNVIKFLTGKANIAVVK